MLIRIILFILLAFLLCSLLYLVVINNGVKVPVNLSPMKEVQDYEVSLVILISLVSGVLFASVIGIVEGWRLRLQNYQLRKKIQRMETELRGLRSITMRSSEHTDKVDEESAL